MTIEIGFVLLLIITAFVLFVTEKLPMDVTALFILSIMLIASPITHLTLNDAISGFSNPAVLTIATLFILGHALHKTGVLEYLVISLNKLARKNLSLGMLIYFTSIALASAFVNNTAIVAIFIPVTVKLAQKFKISPSKVLIPLSYAAIMGGTLTLIGTSTNLIVNSILVESSGTSSLGMFEFSKYGLFIIVVGAIYLMIFGNRLLPNRAVTSSLTKSYHLGGYLTEMEISEDSPLVGTTCVKRAINQNYDVMVLNILRNGKLIRTSVPETTLNAGDILFVRGDLEGFIRMKEVEKINMLTDMKLNQEELTKEDNVLVECLVTDKSNIIGKSLMEINFKQKFDSFVLAIRREGAILRKKIAHTVIHAFDTMLIYGPRRSIHELAQSDDYIVISEVEATLKKHRLWWITPAAIGLVVLLAALSIVPILKGAILAFVLLLVTRVLTPNEAYHAIRWQVIVMIAAMIPLGHVIQTSGTAAWIGSQMTSLAHVIPESMRAVALLSLVYLITMIMTETSSNAATAIIMTPISIAVAGNMGLDPRPFVFAICFAASASFATPVGYQTNLMVYGPGGYKFTDYIRIGLPLSIILWILATIMIPVIWPLQP